MPRIVETTQRKSPVQMISDEAERRMAVGITVDGLPFRCDDASTQRVAEMVSSFQDRQVGRHGLSFRTRAGHRITLTRKAQAAKLLAAQRAYRAACLATSAALQDTLPPDPLLDRHWPAVPALTL